MLTAAHTARQAPKHKSVCFPALVNHKSAAPIVSGKSAAAIRAPWNIEIYDIERAVSSGLDVVMNRDYQFSKQKAGASTAPALLLSALASSSAPV